MEDNVEGRASHEVTQEDDGQVKNASWGALFNFTTKAHILPLLIAVLLSISSGIVVPALAIFLGKLFNLFTEYGAGKLSGPELVHKISTYDIYMLVLAGASMLFNAGYFGFWLYFGELQAKSVRDRVSDGLLKKDMEWFDMRTAGVNTLLSRLQTNIRELQMATSQPLGFAAQYTVTTIAALGLALYYAWDLALVTLAVVPVSALILGWISAQTQPAIKAQMDELTQASKLANNSISSIDTVKFFNGQDFEMWQYGRAIRRAAKFYLVQARANAFQIGLVRFVTSIMFVQGFWYGSHLITTGRKNPGQILTAFWACLMATQTVEQILPQMLVLEKGRASAATLKAMLTQMESGRKTTRMEGGTIPRYCEGDIEIRNVSFRYPSRPADLALDHASFFLPSGETTFVVGKSGSGKSTLGNLLMRYYRTMSGDVLIDGNSIQTLDINWLRNNVTLVQQQSVLFNETIFKNIALGRRDHDDVKTEEVKRTIGAADLHQTVNELPQGLDTLVGAGGSALSGGQKQRVAIARARLRDTPILILDEATSALDYTSRVAVMNNIREWRRGKTTIMITHDLSQIKEDDYVYVMEEGTIVEEGFREALENTSSGGFVRLLQPEVGFPRDYQLMSPKQRRTSHLPEDEQLSPTSSRTPNEACDPMDVQFHPRRRLIPSVFGVPPAEEFGSRRPSQGLVLPLSPRVFQMNRLSTAPASFVSSRRKNSQAIELLGPLSNSLESLPHDVPLKALRARLSRVSENASTTFLGSTHERRRSSMASTKLFQRSNPPEDHKAHYIAPVGKILKTVWPSLTWSMRIVLVLGFICAAVHAAATPVFSWVFAKLLATFYLPENRSQAALKWSLSVIGVAFGDATASYLMHYLLEYCGQAWIDTLRIEAMKRVLDQPKAWFDRDKNSLTKLTECLDRNAEETRNLLGRFAAFIFVAVLMIGMAVIWSLATCWKLTLVGLASAPFLYGLTHVFETVSGIWERRSNEAGGTASSIFTETFGNIRTVRALTLEGYFHQKYRKATDNAMMVGVQRSAIAGFFFGLSDSGIIFIIAFLFYYGSVVASSKKCSVENILTVFTMLLFSIANANNIVAFIPQISSSKDTATRLLRLTKLPYQESHEHGGTIRLPHLGLIDFDQVSFSYPTRPWPPVLSALSLSVDPGTSTALIGASGSGKSTIASLLLGLYPLDSGNITFSSFPITALHLPTLRSLISVIPQTPALFSASIAENITYGLPEASPLATLGSVRAACSASGIDEFVMSLPDGFDTQIGDGGTALSGGQAQRIAIARAIIRKPELLILDEATSPLDGESARAQRVTGQTASSQPDQRKAFRLTQRERRSQRPEQFVTQGSLPGKA
ncbi:MAG: hypothetical protein Q9195_003089 [Heterodermia aff. obscurata]